MIVFTYIIPSIIFLDYLTDMAHSDDQLEEIVESTICQLLVRDNSSPDQDFFEDIFTNEKEKCFVNSLIRRTLNICDNN